MRYASRSRRNRMIKPLVATAVLIGLGVIGYIYTQQSATPPRQATDTRQPSDDTVATDLRAEQVEGRYLLTGTIVLARGVEQQAFVNGAYDYEQPFSQLSTLNPDDYDAWVTDLECPITDRIMTFREQVETLVFNCRPEFLDPIKKYFDIINLANNHSSDQGEAAFIETQERLDEAGLQAFGNYDPSVKDDICNVVALPVRLQSDEAEEETATLPVAFCAWHYFTQEPSEGELDVMLEYVDIMPVFAFTHGGIEYVAEAQPNQVELAHGLVDRGADFVINNNPHWVQNSEVYNGKLIVYSTGNFIFDQLDQETNRAANIDVSLKLDYDQNVQSWIELGENCKSRNDTCLEQAQQQQLSKVSPTLTYDVIASLNGYREITRRADQATQSAVEDRLNWPVTLRLLGQSQ